MASGKLETHVSQAAYATLRCVDRATVSRWKQKGLLVLDDETGLVDVAATNSRVDSRPNVYRGGRTARTDTEAEDAAAKALRELQAGGPPMTLAQATLMKETYLARLRAIEHDQLIGAVVLVEDVAVEVASVFNTVRSLLLGLPSKMATQLAACSDPKECERILRGAINEALKELSSAPDEDDDADQ